MFLTFFLLQLTRNARAGLNSLPTGASILVTNKKGTREKKKERGRERERKREKEREKRERERERKCLYGFKSVLAFSSVPTIKSHPPTTWHDRIIPNETLSVHIFAEILIEKQPAIDIFTYLNIFNSHAWMYKC